MLGRPPRQQALGSRPLEAPQETLDGLAWCAHAGGHGRCARKLPSTWRRSPRPIRDLSLGLVSTDLRAGPRLPCRDWMTEVSTGRRSLGSRSRRWSFSMASNPQSAWRPDWTVAPGEILLEALQDRGVTQSELAQRLARPLKTVNEIIKGKAAITPEKPSNWNARLESRHVFGRASRRNIATLSRSKRRSENWPLRRTGSTVSLSPDLVKHKQLQRGASKGKTLANLLSYLGVSSPAAFDRLDVAAAYRGSPAFTASPKAVTTWLRWGEIEAAKADVPPFDARRFRQALGEIRPLTRREPFAQVFKRVKAMCADAGVVVLLIPELTGTHLSGASRWVGSKPVIQLSRRHKSDDQFWFTFFHEAGHLLSRHSSPRLHRRCGTGGAFRSGRR